MRRADETAGCLQDGQPIFQGKSPVRRLSVQNATVWLVIPCRHHAPLWCVNHHVADGVSADVKLAVEHLIPVLDYVRTVERDGAQVPMGVFNLGSLGSF